jgi:hypothetical protein
MSRAGHRNGFNPFRKGGKFATPGGADGSSDSGAGDTAASLGVTNERIGATSAKVNAAIRTAAGRGGAAGGSGGGSAQSADEAHYDKERAQRAAAPAGGGKSLAEVDDMIVPNLAMAPKGMRETLNRQWQAASAGGRAATPPLDPDESNLNTIGAQLLEREMIAYQGQIRPETTKALTDAFAASGYTPSFVDDAQMARMANESAKADHYPQHRAWVAAAALRQNEPLRALTFLQGPQEAGFSWGETIREMEDNG